MTKRDFNKVFGKVITAGFEYVTPTLAKEMLEYNIGNRDVKLKKIITMVQAMKEGRWLFNGDSIRFNNNGDLIDGQNRLLSIIKAGIPQPCLVVRGLDPEAAKTIDIGSKRQLKDWLQFLNIPNSTIIAPALRALSPYYVEDAPKRIGDSINKYEVSIESSLALFDEIRESLALSAEYAKANKRGNPLTPSQTTTIFHVLTEASKTLGEDFMNELCKGINLEENSPTYKLRAFLTKKKEDARCGKASSLRASYIYGLTVKAWNYWVQEFDMPDEELESGLDFPTIIVPE